MKTKSFFQSILFAILVFVLSYIISGILYQIFGIPRFSNNVYKYLVLVLTVVIISSLLFFVKRKWVKDVYSSLRISKGILSVCLKIFSLTLLSIVAVTCLVYIFHFIEFKSIDALNIKNIGKFFFLSFFVALTEEILFRGYVLNFCIAKIGQKFSVILVSVVFALSHFGNHTLAPYIITFLGGLVFAVLCIRTRSLLPAITFHLVWNFSQMLISGLFEQTQLLAFNISQIVILILVLTFLKVDVLNKKIKCNFSHPK